MQVFEWDDRLRTGIDAIDEQHKRLIALVNELAEAMRSGKSREAMDKVFGGLREYTEYHFGFEEAAFARHGYGRAAEHAAAHRDLVRKLDELSAKREAGLMGISVDVLDFLTGWVKNHIMKEDMEYVPFLKDKAL